MQKQTIPQTPFRFIWFITKPYKKWMFLSIALVTCAELVSSGSYYIFKIIVDSVESGNAQLALWVGLLYPLVMLTTQILYRCSGLTVMRWTGLTEKSTYEKLVPYLMKHSHKYFSDRFAGSILNKIGNVIGAIDQVIMDGLWTQLTAIVSFIVTIGFILTVDVTAAALFGLLVIVLIAVNRTFAKEKQKRAKASAAAKTELRGYVVDVISNIGAVRQYVRGFMEKETLTKKTEASRKAHEFSWVYTEQMLFVNSFILFGFASLIFYILVTKWSSNLISTGDFILVLSLVTSLSGTLIFIGRAFNNTAKAIGEAKEGLEDLLIAHEVADASDTALVSKDGEIAWQNVSFAFEKNEVFKDFNLTIKPGERIGLVGPSGAGKTTFVSLLLRQHDVDNGAILIDGQDISTVTQDSLREHIAVVPQEPLLFHRSIKENILYGKPDATEEEIIEVAKKAQAHEFISTLPEGYDTLVGERGVKLSGGQKQRVAIARAMLKDAPILVLDEATSALDSESEVAIQRALHELMEGKTVIAVAHRLSTLREMDRILVLEGGQIVEDGSHAELVEAGGTYARLWEHQAGGFLQE